MDNRATRHRKSTALTQLSGHEVQLGGMFYLNSRLMQATEVERDGKTEFVLDEVTSLFVEFLFDNEAHVYCSNCGANTLDVDSDNLIDADSWNSFGGTTEGYETCKACGFTVAHADMSAII